MILASGESCQVTILFDIFPETKAASIPLKRYDFPRSYRALQFERVDAPPAGTAQALEHLIFQLSSSLSFY